MAPTNTNEEIKEKTEVSHPPNDAMMNDEQQPHPMEPPLCQDNDDETNDLHFLDGFLMNDEEGFGGEFSQEEIEALLATKHVPPILVKDSQSM